MVGRSPAAVPSRPVVGPPSVGGRSGRTGRSAAINRSEAWTTSLAVSAGGKGSGSEGSTETDMESITAPPVQPYALEVTTGPVRLVAALVTGRALAVSGVPVTRPASAI